MYNIGIDLGGTNIKVGIVDEKYNIVGRTSVKTGLPCSGEKIVATIAEAVYSACENAGVSLSEIRNAGIGVPGASERESGIVLYSNNLKLRNFEIGKQLKERINKTVYVENDANAAAYGEVLCGAGKGRADVIVVTLGTGVGSGIIIDGRIYGGFNYCAGEIGHTVIEHGGRQCSCGRKGCFEAYSSATGLVNMTREAMDADKNTIMHELCKSGKISGRTAFEGMRLGDKTAAAVVWEYISYLGVGLTNIVNTFQPELLLIGGGICGEGEELIKPLREIIERDSYSIEGAPKTRLDVAKLGNDAGIIGAAFLFRLC